MIATGLNKGRLGLPEEDEYEGRGLSHCASCDGPLYAGLPVIVAGAGGWAALRSRGAEGIRQRSHRRRHGARPSCPTACTAIDGRIVALEGSDGLQSVVVESGGARKTIPASAVFVYVGQSPAAEFLPDSLARDATGHIVVDDEGRTSAPTAFAVGDVRAGARYIWPTPSPTASAPAQAVVAALAKTS